MQFSPQQDKALAAVAEWLRNKDKPIFRLFGFAGTGKTTLARHFAEGVEGTVLFAAYTGKATHVLRTKGCPNTSTIHQLIYQPKSKSQARLKELQVALSNEMHRSPVNHTLVAQLEKALKEEKDNMKRPMWQLNTSSPLKSAKLLIVDECSMVDGPTAEDLLSFDVPILALGDPGQLPPVRGTGYFTNAKADFLLTDIHRQAKDNPIIEMSRLIREEGFIRLGKYGDSEVVDGKNFQRQWVHEADQILVGLNETRRSYNNRIRELAGAQQPLPTTGDKLVCLRNNHEAGLLNGSLWKVRGVRGDMTDEQLILSLEGEDGQVVDSVAHACYFHGQEPEWYEKSEADEFDYGYALTVHKSQGSQFDKVLVIDEWRRADRRQWLYTAVTRAAQKVRVARM